MTCLTPSRGLNLRFSLLLSVLSSCLQVNLGRLLLSVSSAVIPQLPFITAPSPPPSAPLSAPHSHTCAVFSPIHTLSLLCFWFSLWCVWLTSPACSPPLSIAHTDHISFFFFSLSRSLQHSLQCLCRRDHVCSLPEKIFQPIRAALSPSNPHLNTQTQAFWDAKAPKRLWIILYMQTYGSAGSTGSLRKQSPSWECSSAPEMGTYTS